MNDNNIQPIFNHYIEKFEDINTNHQEYKNIMMDADKISARLNRTSTQLKEYEEFLD